MKWANNDGGRARAGFKGINGDCVTRAIAIATGMPYEVVVQMVDLAAREEGRDFRNRSNSQTGVYWETEERLLTALGWTWVPKTGRGRRKMFLREDQVPGGTVIVSLGEHLSFDPHYATVVNGVLQDTYDCSAGGTRRVLGYWKKG